MPESRIIPLVTTPNDLENWLLSYRLSKYPDDEPGVWSTYGRISYHSPEHGSITFVVKVPQPGRLLILSIEYTKSDQAQVYVESLLNEIINWFGDEELKSLRERLRIHTNNRQRLQEQLAKVGFDLKLLNLLDDEEKAIKEVELQIRQRETIILSQNTQ